MNKKKIAKIIEIVLLVAGILATVAVVIAIPLKSYREYADYFAWIEEMNKPEIKPVLESISVELKEDVKYFKNDLAEPKASDFLVTANYTLDGVPYSETIEEGKFSFTTENDFYSVGGDITVTYKNKTAVLNIELIPIKLESISVAKAPYKVRYQTGSTFDAEGLVLTAHYNDGSTQTIPAEKYAVDAKELTPADSSVNVSYTEGKETKTVAISVMVFDVLDDGAVVAIVLTGDAIVQSGSKLADTDMEISAIYESGNRKRLTKDEYTVSGGNTVANLGKAYTISVSYNENPTISLTTGVIVRTTVQGESGIIVGGNSNTETEYAVVDGVITQLQSNISFAGNFGKTVLNGGEGSLTVTVNSESAIVGDITMRCGNSYCCFVNGANKNDGYRMLPLQINTILDLTVNGKEVAIPDSVVLKGTDIHKDYQPLYSIYYEFTFENIALDAGTNTIKVSFKNSTAGAMTCWNESPSTLNIDYVNVDAVGNEIPDSFDIEQIELSPNYTVAVGGKLTNIKPPVVATLSNGTKVLVSSNLFNYEVSGGKEGATVTEYGKYTVTATLKSNPEVKASREIEFVGIKVLHASVEQQGDRVYYVFSGTSYGYTAEDLQFFDNAKLYDLIVEFTGNTFTFKIDVTLLPAGTVIYPHLRVQGKVYYNGGANSNGDIRGNGLKFEGGQKVTLNGQVYTITREYEMPTLKITAVPESN